MPLERLGDESRGLHLLDELAEVFRAGFAAPGRSHRLIDHHEPTFEQAQSGNAPSIGLELLLYAGGNFELLRYEHVGDGRGGGCPDDLRVLQVAREEQIVSASGPDGDPHALAIDIRIAANRRALRQQGEPEM